MPFEAYLLSLRADDAIVVMVLGSMTLIAVSGLLALGFGRIVSPRMEG